MQLLVNKLKDSQSIDLLVLKEVIQRMTGVEVLQDMSNDQIAASGGGDVLRAEAFTFDKSGSAKSLAKVRAKPKRPPECRPPRAAAATARRTARRWLKRENPSCGVRERPFRGWYTYHANTESSV
eukprot:7255238-Pyramimonas_sp.AAC.1